MINGGYEDWNKTLKMISAVYDIKKNLLGDINSRLADAESNILEFIAIEIIQNVSQKEKECKNWTEHQWPLGQY